MKQTTSKIEIEKGKEEKKDKLNKQQERKKEVSAQGKSAHMQTRTQRVGGVSPRQNNRIRHREEQGSEKVIEEGDTRDKRKTTKRKGRGNGEWQKGKKKRSNKNEKGIKQRCPGGTMLTT